MLSRVGRRCGASIAAAAFANVICRPVRPLPPFFSRGDAGSVRGTDLFVRREQRLAAAASPQVRNLAAAAPINVNALKVTPAAVPKTKPPFDASLSFGTSFSDHMLEIEWDVASGFGEPRIVPYHALELDPASPCLHYGVQCFEGMKAYKDESGAVRLFRPDMNMKRFKTSCERLSLPVFEEEQMLACLKKLIEVDKDWVPGEAGYSLYIRPTALATSSTLGVTPPSHALFQVVAQRHNAPSRRVRQDNSSSKARQDRHTPHRPILALRNNPAQLLLTEASLNHSQLLHLVDHQRSAECTPRLQLDLQLLENRLELFSLISSRQAISNRQLINSVQHPIVI